jgi:hypothetical protein
MLQPGPIPTKLKENVAFFLVPLTLTPGVAAENQRRFIRKSASKGLMIRVKSQILSNPQTRTARLKSHISTKTRVISKKPNDF